MKPWLLYTLARLGIFAAALALLILATIPWYWAAILAAIIGLLVSYIALPKLRSDVAMSLATRRRTPGTDQDTSFEDDLVDSRNDDA